MGALTSYVTLSKRNIEDDKKGQPEKTWTVFRPSCVRFKTEIEVEEAFNHYRVNEGPEPG
jgi:hypothetical protein